MRRVVCALPALVLALVGTRAEASKVVYVAGSAPAGEAVIRDVFPDHLETAALNVARCESGPRLNGNAVNGRYQGLFQLGPAEWRKHRPSADADIYDRRSNALAALSLYRSRGWQPWQCRP